MNHRGRFSWSDVATIFMYLLVLAWMVFLGYLLCRGVSWGVHHIWHINK